jgi:hypothetical protein
MRFLDKNRVKCLLEMLEMLNTSWTFFYSLKVTYA